MKHLHWSQFCPIEDADGNVVGYRHQRMKANDYVQYAAAYSQYKPVYDLAGNVGGFQFVPKVQEEDPPVIRP